MEQPCGADIFIYLKPQIVTVVSQVVTSGWKRIFEIFQ
jgi:hypothetical protein